MALAFGKHTVVPSKYAVTAFENCCMLMKTGASEGSQAHFYVARSWITLQIATCVENMLLEALLHT